jgi:hypothetical protein
LIKFQTVWMIYMTIEQTTWERNLFHDYKFKSIREASWFDPHIMISRVEQLHWRTTRQTILKLMKIDFLQIIQQVEMIETQNLQSLQRQVDRWRISKIEDFEQ